MKTKCIKCGKIITIGSDVEGKKIRIQCGQCNCTYVATFARKKQEFLSPTIGGAYVVTVFLFTVGLVSLAISTAIFLLANVILWPVSAAFLLLSVVSIGFGGVLSKMDQKRR